MPHTMNRVTVFVLLAWAGGVAPAAEADSEGGHLEGRVSAADTGVAVRRVAVRATGHGRTITRGSLTENDGSYLIRDLDPGRYAVAVAVADRYRPAVLSDVLIQPGETTRVDLKVEHSLAIEGDSWVQAYPSFLQEFRATGLGITAIGIKAFGPGRRVKISVRDGQGPGGEAIGPARPTDKVGGEGSAVVMWAGDEIATRPGQHCTVELSALEGQVWVPGVAGRGDVYPGGSAWFGGSPRPDTDLGILICEDNDGLRTSYALGGSGRAYRTRAAGQTFTALSRNVTFASAVLSGVEGPPVYVRFSIHEGGPGGRQIGPSKGVPASQDAAVAWGPDEVPVSPGQRYYLHIESFSETVFLVSTQADAYANGQAAFEGRPDPERDLCAVVMGELSAQDFARLVRHDRHADVVELDNASFEKGDRGWHRDGEMGDVVGCDGGIVPAWGQRMFGWTNLKEGENSRPVIYQEVKARAGETYVFSGSVYTDHEGGRSSDVKARLIVLPDGGVDVRDNETMESSQWYATEGQWRRGSVVFRAAADTITVGFELEQRFNLDRSSVYADGAFLERIESD